LGNFHNLNFFLAYQKIEKEKGKKKHSGSNKSLKLEKYDYKFLVLV